MKIERVDPAKKKRLHLKMKITGVVSLFVVLTASYFLTSKKWSSYVYLLSDKQARLVFVGEFKSQNKCTQKSQQKLTEGIQITRDDKANSYLCGKYCLEVPLSVLTSSNLFCLFRVQSH